MRIHPIGKFLVFNRYECLRFYNLKNHNFQKLVYGLFFLSIILEFLQFIVPNRAFEIYDVFANFAGVLVAYLLVVIYKFWNKP